MAFHELNPLECVAMGASGGPSFNTGIVSVRSGAESRNGYWSHPRHRFDVGMVARPLSEFTAIKDAFMIVGGRRDGFRFQDFGDYATDASNGKPHAIMSQGLYLGPAGFGYGVPIYQIRKLYSYNSSTYYRDIRKPRSGGVVVHRGVSTVTAGVAAGNYALDTTTGVITFVADQTRGITSHTVGAAHVVTMSSAMSPNFAIGGRIYLTDVTGTAADVLNGLSHEITGVTAGAITTTTNTTGLTASNGTAYYYPQPVEALDVVCSFDVPVRFDVDNFDAVVRDRQGAQGELIFELPSIPLIEIRV